MTNAVPSFARAHEAISEVRDLSMAERAVLLASIRWVNFRTGQLWPSVGEWAKGAGVTDRGLNGIMRKLVGRGIVRTITASKGGRGQTSVYQIPMLAVDGNPEQDAGFTPPETPNAKAETPNVSAETPNHDGGKPARNPEPESRNPERGARNPERQSGNPEQLVRRNNQEQPEELSKELPNAGARKSVHAVDRFQADRQHRTGTAPPGFSEFIDEYPTGKAPDRGGLLGLWRALGLEDDREAVLAGLRAWKGCEEWQRGYAVKARKFLDERYWETAPPPPKPEAQAPEKVRPW